MVVLVAAFCCVALGFTGVYLYVKHHPPLVQGVVGTGDNEHVVLVEVGNKGFKGIELTDVSVNNNEKPQDLKMQVSNPIKGLIISEPNDSEAKDYGMTDLNKVKLKPGSSIKENLDKVNKGTATDKDKSYGITISHDTPITTVSIKYRYLGLSFMKKVQVVPGTTF